MLKYVLLFFIAINSANAEKNKRALAGGDVTVFNSSRDAYAKPAPNLSVEDLRKFTFGNKIFNTNWVTAPASVTSLDGLGPLFNRVSCSGCHFKDGRGRPPYSKEEPFKSMLMRVSTKTKNGDKDHPHYGGQFQDKAIMGVAREGKVEIEYEEIKGRYPDGKKYKLRNPKYNFVELNYGPKGDGFLSSPRVAPSVYGMGLLEAISENDILKLFDPLDRDGDGITGKANYVWDIEKKQLALGRFGWKAGQPSIKQQSATAAWQDIGLTSSVHPNENCLENQTACKKVVNGGSPELSDFQLERMVFYLETLAVPARRNLDDKDVIKGEELFKQVSCSACHTPKHKTGGHKNKALSNQEIQAFTDMLLHDMGEGLADNRPEAKANGREWRTPPLWGIGLVKTVNKHTFFLHDGRARNIEEAILWHGGEAERSKQKFMNLSKGERKQLIKFLNSL